MDPDLARRLARAAHRGWHSTDGVAYRTQADPTQVERLLTGLQEAGFLERHERTDWDGTTVVEWGTTVRGGALANASFLKPMTRTKAQTLLDGVLERVAAYNADPDKPMWIDRINAFGSFIDPDATSFGDLDLQVVTTFRPDEANSSAALDYARRSGRTFSSFFDKLAWPEVEARQVVKNRSGFISVHTEDISVFTDRWETVYDRTIPTP